MKFLVEDTNWRGGGRKLHIVRSTEGLPKTVELVGNAKKALDWQLKQVELFKGFAYYSKPTDFSVFTEEEKEAFQYGCKTLYGTL
jgi:hypothetical protein